MKPRRSKQGILLIVLVAGMSLIWFHRWSLRKEAPSVLVDAVAIAVPEPVLSTCSLALEDESATPTNEPDVLSGETMHLSPDELRELLPEWMDYEGVHLHSEHVTVAGRMVSRTRGRFEWPNGSFMEMEVTDLGGDSDEILLKSLGFNVDILGDAPSNDSVLVPEIPHSLLSQEYDEETEEGFVQLVVGNRFLVEVQLQNLPYESFQTIIDFQIPLDELMALAVKRQEQ